MAVVVDPCSSLPPLSLAYSSASKIPSPPLHLHTSSSDFDFRTTTSSSTTSADVLFSNGKLLPLLPFTPAPPSPQETNEDNRPHRLEELISSSPQDQPNKPRSSPKRPTSTFWKFSRSTGASHGGGNRHQKTTGGLNFSLHFLPRSKSAGSSSSTNPKSQRRSSSSPTPTAEPRCLRKSSTIPKAAPLASSYYYGSSKKASVNAGVRVNPVLNVTGNGFFGYLLCGAKEKSATKKKATHFP